MGVGGQHNGPTSLPPGMTRPGTHCVEGYVGPEAGLDGCGKSFFFPWFDPQTVHPVVQSLYRLNYVYSATRRVPALR